MDDFLVIPFDEDLTTEEGWTKIGKYLYFAARYHLCTDDEQTDEFRLGNILRTFRILIDAPLFKMNYWKLESESSLLFTENEYRQALKVQHPDRVTFEELDEELDLPLPQKLHRPTLYKLSKIAFPVRWVDRQGPWTRPELEKIELDEAEGSAWWFEHGPGRRPPSRSSR